MAYIPESNSVIAFQSNPSSLLAGVSVMGLTPVAPTPSSVYVVNPVSTLSINTGNSSVQLLVGQAVIGSVAVLQGTNPWQVNVPTSSYISYQLAGSVLAVSGSFTTGNSSVQVVGVMPPQSVSGVGLFNVNHIGNGSVIAVGQYLEKNATVASAFGMPILWKNNFTTSTLSTISTNDPLPVQGSVTTLQGTSPWLITGSVMNRMSTGVSSVELMSTSASIATQVNRILTGVSSVQLMAGINNAGSITAIQGTNPWLIGNSSVMVIQGTTPFVVGSVIATIQANSIVGTYAEDSAHTTASNGLFVMQVRNDTMSSITSTDGDYSPIAGGPVGETITANSPITKWFSQNASVMYGTSVQVVAAPGASIFSYITGIHVMNESATFSRVTITQGLGAVAASILTRVAAPATGGSNSNYINPIRVLDNNGISASISGVSSVLITITGFNAKV